MNQTKNKHADRYLKFKQLKSRAQALMEFALALPILLLLIFGIIDFSLVFQAWLSIENISRQTMRYAVTGQYEEKFCTTDNGWNWNSDSDGSEICEGAEAIVEQDRARLLSIQAMANSQKVALFDTPGLTQDETGYINVVVCSNRDGDDEGDDPDYVYTAPSGSVYSSCTNGGSPRDDAGAPGDQVYIAVDFNHPFITPFLSAVWPQVHLASHREGRVETFRSSKLMAFPDMPEVPDTLTPSNTPSLTPSLTFTPSNTPTFTPTINPLCTGIAFKNDWSITNKDLKIKVENTSSADVYVQQAVVNWDNYDTYALEQSVMELEFDTTKILTGEDPDSLTDSGSGHNVRLEKNKAKDFKVKFKNNIHPVATGNFGLALTFTNGCVLYKPVTATLPTATAGPTSDAPPVPVGGEGEIWYRGTEDPSVYLHVEWETNPDGSVTVLATFSTNFNDNTYGAGTQTDWPAKRPKCKNNNGSGQCDPLKYEDTNNDGFSDKYYICTVPNGACNPPAFYPFTDQNGDGQADPLACTDADGDGFCDNIYEIKDKDGDGVPDAPHTFRELYHSDHVRFDMKDVNGNTFFDAKMDLLSADPTAPSGWNTLGVTGDPKDSEVFVGNASMVSGFRTSLSENFNTLGCSSETSSPIVDENYNQDPTDPNYCPGYDFSVWFEITVDAASLPPGGFGYPHISSIHASPSKRDLDTQIVVPGASPTPTLTPSTTPTITSTPLNTSTPLPTFTPTLTITPGGPTYTNTPSGEATETPTLIYWDP